MYNNHEPRFCAAIGFCHSFWPGTSSSESQYKNIEATYYSGRYASANPDHPEDYDCIGYTHVKYRHSEDEMKKSTVKAKYFPVFRYAEALLNYVEAINELKEPYTPEIPDGSQVTAEHNTAGIVKYFNLIRYRTGLPGITEAVAVDRSKVRELIKYERRIELAYKGYRYHDLRRWGGAMEAYNRPISGCSVKTRGNERQKFYTTTILNNRLTRRSFSYKHYFHPVPKSVLGKNKNPVQNPEWK